MHLSIEVSCYQLVGHIQRCRRTEDVSVFLFLKWPLTRTIILLFVGRQLYKSSYGKNVKKTTTFR